MEILTIRIDFGVAIGELDDKLFVDTLLIVRLQLNSIIKAPHISLEVLQDNLGILVDGWEEFCIHQVAR